jgi:hypothetical protein
MGKVSLIATHYVFTVEYEGEEYEVTCSQDLKSVYNIYPENKNVIAILDVIWAAFFKNEIENFN